MKLSEFKAQYFPWSKAYKEREAKEKKERQEALDKYYASRRKSYEDLTSLQAQVQTATLEREKKIKPLVKQAEPTVQTNSTSSFGETLVASALGNMIGNALSDSFSSRSSSSDSSSSWSSGSDSSSSWSDSSSSSWSDSSSSSWD